MKNYDSTLEGIGFSVSTVMQILTSGKADLKYYNEKLTRIKNSIESLEETAEADEKFIKQVEKIENNFIRLTSFAINYFKIIESKKGYLDSKDKAYLKKLERDEMSISLKKLGESFLFLKNAKLGDILAHEKSSVSNRTIPTLGEIFQKLFTTASNEYSLKTPFGIAKVKLINNPYGIEFMIYHGGSAWPYDDICKNLDFLLLCNTSDLIINVVIIPIISYLKIGSTINLSKIQKYDGYKDKDIAKKNQTIQKIFDMFTSNNSNIDSLKIEPNKKGITKSSVLSSAISLSGILVLAEACRYRNPTFGKLERNAMKTVLRLTQNGCTNPFAKVFSNEKGRYVPAHSQGGNMDTQLLLSYNFDSDSVKARFLPLPRDEQSNDLIKDLLLSENPENLKEIKNICYPHSWKSFFEDMEKGSLCRETVNAVFVEFEKLFSSQRLVPVEDFMGLSVNNKKKIVRKIKNYSPKDEPEKSNVSSFVAFINTRVPFMYIKGDMEAKINKEGVKPVIERIKSSGNPKVISLMAVMVYDLCWCDQSKYIVLKDLPALPSRYLTVQTSLDLRSFMLIKIEKELKRLYKSQNQVLTKNQIKILFTKK